MLAIPFLVAACGGGSGGGAAQSLSPAAPVEGTFAEFQFAILALGQADLESGAPNRGQPEPDERTLASPVGLALAPDGGLLVADAANHRVLYYDVVPADSGSPAVAVLGQAGFRTATPSVSQGGLNFPFGVGVGGGRVAVAEALSHRVVIYDDASAIGTVLPSVVIGQPDFGTQEPGCGASGLFMPMAAAITPDGSKLVVVDNGNNRVLVWDPVPQPGEPVPAPALVLGQRDADHCTANDDDQDGQVDLVPGTTWPRASASTLSGPTDVWTNGDKLVVADGGNSRVLVWNRFPQDSFQAASVVLGHAGFTNSQANSEGDAPGLPARPTARTLAAPGGVHSDGNSLAVADTGNQRVLVWNTFPSENLQAADLVFGQPNFHESVTNDGNGDGLTDAPRAQVFRQPLRVLLAPAALLVSDLLHNRVLVFRR